jgi:ADP-glucose pyrophosphorylase
MDYAPFVAAHRRHGRTTIAVRRVPLAEASRMGILALDENDRVVEWQEKL